MDSRIDEIYQTMLAQSEQRSEHHSEVKQMLGHMQGQIDAVLTEARRTNGRVTKLETEVQMLRNWRWYVMGGATALVALFEAFKEKIFKF
jgi:polyhydroxyalkanoate synthesis regulator phasin